MSIHLFRFPISVAIPIPALRIKLHDMHTMGLSMNDHSFICLPNEYRLKTKYGGCMLVLVENFLPNARSYIAISPPFFSPSVEMLLFPFTRRVM